jgi:uncharacterized protein (DUF952 family)
MIYHITTPQLWESALQKGYFEAPSLHSEGFIHTSRQQQVQGVLNRYYSGNKSLLLLHIDENKVISEIKYELAPSVNEEFPHIYGKLNLDAVIKVSEISNGIYER